MSRKLSWRYTRIGARHGAQHSGKDLVLPFVIRCIVLAFELNPDGEIVTASPKYGCESQSS
jgi:hypothetical protein